MSDELQGLMLLLPRDLQRAAYLTYGMAQDAGLHRALACQVETDGRGHLPLEAALVLGNPPSDAAAAFGQVIEQLWTRLVPNAPLILGSMTAVGRVLRRRDAVMNARQTCGAVRRLGASIHRTWTAYPSLEKPTILASVAAGRDLRHLALAQAGVHGWLPAFVAGRGLAAPARLWEFRK